MPSLAYEYLVDASMQQSTYRGILRALSYPGTIVSTVTEGISAEGGGEGEFECLHHVVATLLDSTVSCADPSGLVPDALRDFLGYRSIGTSQADFVLASGKMGWSRSETPRLGDLFRPHLGATMILLCDRLGEGPLRLRVSGPGVKGSQTLKVDGLSVSWIECRHDWVAKFPMGVDLLLCDQNQVVGIPRTSIVELI